MFRKRSVFGFLSAILVVLLLLGGGAALFRAGYAQGYTTGLVTEGEAGELVSPENFYPRFSHHYRYPMGFFPGHLFGLFFGGLLFLMILRLIFFRRRGMCGPHPAAWKHWYQNHPEAQKWGPPPWAKDWKFPEENETPSEEDESEQDA